MNRIIFALAAAGICLGSCTSLTFQEKQELSALEYRGITVDRAPGGWQQPASPLAAGLLNVLPGGGNFYLASGNAADSSHWVYGMVNLLFWPISILWGVPEATIDAGNINKREMLNFYKYGNGGIPDFPGLEAAGRRTMPQQRVAPRQVPYRTQETAPRQVPYRMQETAPRQVPYRNRYHQAPRGYYNNYQTYGY